MRRNSFWLFIFFLSYSSVSSAISLDECQGSYAGRSISNEMLTSIIDAHKKVVEEYRLDQIQPGIGDPVIDKSKIYSDSRYANLCLAQLENADLQGAGLEWANFDGANLIGANLEGARLWKASFIEAFLWRTNVKQVDFEEANLRAAELKLAHLEKTNLRSANLENTKLNQATIRDSMLDLANFNGAVLIGANIENTNASNSDFSFSDMRNAKIIDTVLSGANLESVDMRNAVIRNSNLDRANLKNVIFELSLDSDLSTTRINQVKNLKDLRFVESPHSLIELRNKYKKEGLRTEERDVTYAIKHREMEILLEQPDRKYSDVIESLFMYVAYELTTEWGRSPGRALKSIFYLIFLFAVVYLIALMAPKENAGIWRIHPEDRLIYNNSSDPTDVHELIMPGGLWSTILYALYFSVLSAFHIGWRDFNVGNWITRLQFSEFTFRPTGWVRTVSGIQSLLSVYLLAMWALTYFGRPFE